MLFSNILPVFYFAIYKSGIGIKADASIYYWLFGYAQANTIVGTKSYTQTYFELDLLGIICMILIFIGAFLSIYKAAEESKKPLAGGLLGVISMMIYVIGATLGLLIPRWIALGFNFSVLFLGFYVCILGGILSIIGGVIKEKKINSI